MVKKTNIFGPIRFKYWFWFFEIFVFIASPTRPALLFGDTLFLWRKPLKIIEIPPFPSGLFLGTNFHPESIMGTNFHSDSIRAEIMEIVIIIKSAIFRPLEISYNIGPIITTDDMFWIFCFEYVPSLLAKLFGNKTISLGYQKSIVQEQAKKERSIWCCSKFL